MTSPLPATVVAILAIVVVGGAVVAVSVRDRRASILGLLIALAGAPFLAEPLPDARGIVARIGGAALAASLLLMAVRHHPAATGSRIAAWPVAALVALTAGVATAALASAPILPSTTAETAAAALVVPAASAGMALLALAVSPLLLGGEGLRVTAGLLLGTTGCMLITAAVSGPPSAFADLCVAVLTGTLAGAGSQISGDLDQARSQPGRG